MSTKELERYRILLQVQDNKLTQQKAAELLDLSDRQVRNLLKEIERHGPKGLISKKRGKPSNRAFDLKFKQKVLNLIQTKYEDFGPTLICEKLQEYHQINLCDETIRQWMCQTHLCQQRSKIDPLFYKPSVEN